MMARLPVKQSILWTCILCNTQFNVDAGSTANCPKCFHQTEKSELRDLTIKQCSPHAVKTIHRMLKYLTCPICRLPCNDEQGKCRNPKCSRFGVQP